MTRISKATRKPKGLETLQADDTSIKCTGTLGECCLPKIVITVLK